MLLCSEMPSLIAWSFVVTVVGATDVVVPLDVVFLMAEARSIALPVVVGKIDAALVVANRVEC